VASELTSKLRMESDGVTYKSYLISLQEWPRRTATIAKRVGISKYDKKRLEEREKDSKYSVSKRRKWEKLANKFQRAKVIGTEVSSSPDLQKECRWQDKPTRTPNRGGPLSLKNRRKH